MHRKHTHIPNAFSDAVAAIYLAKKALQPFWAHAFQFTFEGEISVFVEPSSDKRSAIVKVRDTGIGISESEMPKLFERFHRIEGVQGRSYEGSGIGLALVQELVKLHGGEISAESTPGVGTTFTVSLPLGHQHLPSERVQTGSGEQADVIKAHAFVEEALRWLPDVAPKLEVEGELSTAGLGAIASQGTVKQESHKRVLLADDNADMRAYVCRLLQAQGYIVDLAADGEAALQLARQTRPDLILTDVMMPRLDGFGLLKRIRNEGMLAGIPVLCPRR